MTFKVRKNKVLFVTTTKARIPKKGTLVRINLELKYSWFVVDIWYLKWTQLGNPETSDSDDWRGMVDYAWSHAVISDETHKIIRESCDFNSNDTWSNNNCSEAVDELLTQYKEIDIYSLYTSLCIANSASSADGNSVQTLTIKRSTTMVICCLSVCMFKMDNII